MNNLSSKFITPLMEFKKGVSVYSDGFVNSYLGAKGYDCAYGECFFLLYDKPVSNALDEKLTSSKRYKETYCPEYGLTMYVFTIPSKEVETVVRPFLDGKYSEVSRDYVETYFPDDPDHTLYGNRLVLDKSPKLRKYWSGRIGAELPEGAEVWDRPLETNETYDKQVNSQGTSHGPVDAD